jgi:hypothetical protein
MNDNAIEQLLEQAYRVQPWLGVCSVEEAIASAIEYRRNLSDADRVLFDAQIRLGRYPASVIETVEIVSGRDRPHGSEAMEMEETFAAKRA